MKLKQNLFLLIFLLWISHVHPLPLLGTRLIALITPLLNILLLIPYIDHDDMSIVVKDITICMLPFINPFYKFLLCIILLFFKEEWLKTHFSCFCSESIDLFIKMLGKQVKDKRKHILYPLSLCLVFFYFFMKSWPFKDYEKCFLFHLISFFVLKTFKFL